MNQQTIVGCAVLLAASVVVVQPSVQNTLDIEDLMSASEFRAAGLQKLTTDEKTALNRWLTRYSTRLVTEPPNASPAATPNQPVAVPPTQGVVESSIDGTFNGWDGDTVFKLTNGQIWQQSNYAYTYHYAYRPGVLIYPVSGGGFEMRVEGVTDKIRVKRLK